MMISLVVIGSFLLASVDALCAPKVLGISDGRIKDEQFSASSKLRYHHAYRARLNKNEGTRGWCADTNDTNPYIQVNLTHLYHISEIAVQGRNHSSTSGWYITKFRVRYFTGKYFKYIPQRFDGLTSKNDIAKVKVNIKTSIIRIYPTEWHPKVNKSACLRMELYGCRDFCAEGNDCEQACNNGMDKYFCSCNRGYNKTLDGKNCIDIDECKTNNGGCSHNCVNLPNSFKCTCRKGYTFASDRFSCIDNNECLDHTHLCDLQSTECKNRPGDYYCRCKDGYKYVNGYYCLDINECRNGNGGCEEGCHNTLGSYYCSCRSGTQVSSDKHTCIDIDECANGQKRGCQHKCINNYGSYSCGCYTGFELQTDQKSCVDKDECAFNNGVGECGYKCKNTVGSFQCLCSSGYKLAAGQRSCIDINECATGNYSCDKKTSECVNLPGSYKCSCLRGFQLDRITNKCKAATCQRFKSLNHGTIMPSSCYQDDIMKYQQNCSFTCNQGYELHSSSARYATCDKNGNWELNGKSEPQCIKARCHRLTIIRNSEVAPNRCQTMGVLFGETCSLYCNSGYDLIGTSQTTCQQNLKYDKSFGDSKCIKRIDLKCPSDIKLVLPLNASSVSLPLTHLSIFDSLNKNNLKSEPAGVLDGTYKFPAHILSHAVKIIYNTGIKLLQCYFQVTVTDREPPRAINCPTKDIYVTVQSTQGRVTWREPTFTDNVKVTKIIQNVQNNAVLPEHVYFIFYSARDAANNQAVCRFFVHVRAKYCSQATMPGGLNGNIRAFASGLNRLMAFISCPPGKMFSTNITKMVFNCENGVWEDVPDCVAAVAKNRPCPIGFQTIRKFGTTLDFCAKCPRGTKGTAGGCAKCPAGYYQDVEGSTQCIKCPSGKITLEDGVKYASNCQPQCGSGEYSPNGLRGKTGCERCPKGSYQNLEGQKSCKLCPEGSMSTKNGSASEDKCLLPARVSKIVPSTEVVSAKVGRNVTVDCYGTGSPPPHMSIVPAPRGDQNLVQALNTGNKYIVAVRMTLNNVHAADSVVYQCVANNQRQQEGNVDKRDIIIEVQ